MKILKHRTVFFDRKSTVKLIDANSIFFSMYLENFNVRYWPMVKCGTTKFQSNIPHSIFFWVIVILLRSWSFKFMLHSLNYSYSRTIVLIFWNIFLGQCLFFAASNFQLFLSLICMYKTEFSLCLVITFIMNLQ